MDKKRKRPTKDDKLQMRVTPAVNQALDMLAEVKSYETGENYTKSRLVAEAIAKQYPELKSIVRELVAEGAKA